MSNQDPSSLNDVANTANVMFASSPGFVNCAVRSHNPPVLEFKLATDKDAERFRIHLEAHSTDTGFRHQIDPRNPAVVLQYRRVVISDLETDDDKS